MLNLLLLYGGKSGEHEISLRSAASVLAHLDVEQYNVIPVGMDKEGRCYLNSYQNLLNFKDELPVVTSDSRPLPSLLVDGHLAVDADVVFSVAHGPLYEDGALQGLLELANIAYVGCSVLSSAIGMDKDMARRLVGINGIKSAPYRALSWHAPAEEILQFCKRASAELGWPLFVKPCSMGSSVGVQKVHDMPELLSAVSDARRYDETVLVEAFIKGREIELAVLENESPFLRPKVSVPGEIQVHHADGFYSYSAKYLESAETEVIIPAVLDDALVHRLQQVAVDIFVTLKCKGMARVDCFLDDETGEIYFNEINSIPGFTSISMYAKMWQASGLSYAALLDKLIGSAITHHHCRQQLVRHYQ